MIVIPKPSRFDIINHNAGNWYIRRFRILGKLYEECGVGTVYVNYVFKRLRWYKRLWLWAFNCEDW